MAVLLFGEFFSVIGTVLLRLASRRQWRQVFCPGSAE